MGLFSKITDAIGLTDSKAGDRAAATSREASELAAQGQREQLDYLKEVEALPLELRNQFLPKLADIYSGGEGQQTAINDAKNSPLYAAIMGGQAAGEDAIMRNASMTGGLRSGNVNANLTDYGSQLSNKALLDSYNSQLQGIQGLAGIPLNTNTIASATAAPSATIGQGMIAGAQAQQQQSQANMGVLSQLAGGGMMAYAMSDIRLKDNIKSLGKHNGHNIYSWKWNDKALEFDLEGEGHGVMAHEVYEYKPDAVIINDGYLMVDYSQLENVNE